MQLEDFLSGTQAVFFSVGHLLPLDSAGIGQIQVSETPTSGKGWVALFANLA